MASLEVGVGLVNALVPTPELTRLSVRGLPSTTPTGSCCAAGGAPR
ncbi:hypothetical protein [Archangium violaceum]